MNKLSLDKQELVLSQLVEGNSIRAIERITGVNRNTIMSLLVRAGDHAAEAMDKHITNLRSERIQIDEIWGYVGKKEKRVDWIDRQTNPEFGDTYTYVAIDADTKLVPAFHVGKRNTPGAIAVLSQLKERVVTRYQLSTDSFLSYRKAVRVVYGENALDYGQVHKQYSEPFVGEKRYSPARLVGVTLRVVFGAPALDDISTSYIERQNLTMRMGMRRLTRLTNAWSKKFENLVAAVNLHFYHYNFMRTHSTIGSTPAMAAGVANDVWGWNRLLSA